MVQAENSRADKSVGEKNSRIDGLSGTGNRKSRITGGGGGLREDGFREDGLGEDRFTEDGFRGLDSAERIDEWGH